MSGRATDGIVVTRTPVRLSFAGGGTDLAAYYEHHEGVVLSTAISLYVYVTVKRHGDLFGERVRLNYSETEEVQEIGSVRNDIARECLRYLHVDPPVYISTVADVPAASGLGSSSAFAVGLLNALHAWRGERVSAGQLAEEASHVEIEVLKHPIGKQDQYAAAFGGFNLFRFLSTGGVSVEALSFAPGSLEQLFQHLMLFFTGRFRNAGEILAEQGSNTLRLLPELDRLRDYAIRLRSILQVGFDATAFGCCLDETWRIKRDLASGITDGEINRMYETARGAGALGGKLTGAGGGGFLLLLVPPASQAAVREALRGLKEVRLRYEPIGSRVLLPHID